MSENQHAPCPFCGGTELIMINSPRGAKFVLCLNEECKATGPQNMGGTKDEAIAAAWEAWDAAGKRKDAK